MPIILSRRGSWDVEVTQDKQSIATERSRRSIEPSFFALWRAYPCTAARVTSAFRWPWLRAQKESRAAHGARPPHSRDVRPSASSRAVSLVKDLPALDRHIDVLPPSSMTWQTRPVISAA